MQSIGCSNVSVHLETMLYLQDTEYRPLKTAHKKVWHVAVHVSQMVLLSGWFLNRQTD